MKETNAPIFRMGILRSFSPLNMLILLVLCAFSMPVWASDLWHDYDLLVDQPLSDADQNLIMEMSMNPSVISITPILPNPDALHEREVTLTLPGGKSAQFLTVDSYRTKEGYWVWRAVPADGEPGSAILVTNQQGRIIGKIDVQSGFYRLINTGSENHLLLHQERTSVISCTEPAISRSFDLPETEPESDIKRYFQLDVLVLYTGKAIALDNNLVAATRGEEAVTRETIDNIEGEYFSSWMKFNVAGIHHIDYSETNSGDVNSAFSFLRNNSTVSSLRNQYRADVVVLVMSEVDGKVDGSAGNAYRVGQESFGVMKDEAYVVVNVAGLNAGRPVFTHEIGHLLGGRHATDPTGGRSHGYNKNFQQGGTWYHATVMVTDLERKSCSGCFPASNRDWSNPQQSVFDVAMGNEDSDNVHTSIQFAWPRMADLWYR